MTAELKAAKVAILALLLSGPIVHAPGVAQTLEEALGSTAQGADKAATSCRTVRATGNWRRVA